MKSHIQSMLFDIFLPDGKRREELSQAIIKIGRLESASLRLDHPSVHRIHAVIERDQDDRVSVIDLGSSTGTLVNGKAVDKAPLAHGDRLQLGAVELQVWFNTGPDAARGDEDGLAPQAGTGPSQTSPGAAHADEAPRQGGAEPAPTAPNPLAEAMIAQLMGEGAGAEAARFSLDRERAREGMRRFQLSDPNAYVLQLVRAAVIKGASRIDFETDADDLRMRCDGEPFTRADLDGVYDAMFSGDAAPGTQARQALALALTAVSSLSPRLVRLTSGDGATGTELLLRPGQPEEILSPDPAPVGTTVHVRSNLGNQIRDVANRVSAGSPREDLLSTRCQFAALPITLNGAPIAGEALEPFSGLLGLSTLEEADLRIVGGYLPRGAFPPSLRLVQHGVWLAEVGLAIHGPGFVAVASSPRFRADLSQANVVQDAQYERALALAAQVCQDSFRELCKILCRPTQIPASVFNWAADLVRGALWAFPDASAFQTTDEESLLYWLARVPLWREQLQGVFLGQPASLHDLLVRRATGQRVDTVWAPPDADPESIDHLFRRGAFTIRLHRADDRALLVRLGVIQ